MQNGLTQACPNHYHWMEASESGIWDRFTKERLMKYKTEGHLSPSMQPNYGSSPPLSLPPSLQRLKKETYTSSQRSGSFMWRQMRLFRLMKDAMKEAMREAVREAVREAAREAYERERLVRERFWERSLLTSSVTRQHSYVTLHWYPHHQIWASLIEHMKFKQRTFN